MKIKVAFVADDGSRFLGTLTLSPGGEASLFGGLKAPWRSQARRRRAHAYGRALSRSLRLAQKALWIVRARAALRASLQEAQRVERRFATPKARRAKR